MRDSLFVVADAVAEVPAVVDQVVVGHQGSLGVACCALRKRNRGIDLI